jgi:hypothetical protein
MGSGGITPLFLTSSPDVSDQLDVPATLPPGKDPRIEEAECSSEPVRTLWRREQCPPSLIQVTTGILP